MKLDLHYTEPRLVALYDLENARGADTDFYLQLAAELDAQTIIDLGCGTGLLTSELAVDVRTVMGVDPSAPMLTVARARTGAERVQWVEGTSASLGSLEADLAIMSGNVAQIFLEDEEWAATLGDLYAALRVGGYLAFESRNPLAQAWRGWNREATYAQIDSPHGPMSCWLDVLHVGTRSVVFEGHNIFTETGEELVARSELRFRTLLEVTNSLVAAGFTVEHVYGRWDRSPFQESSPLMIFVARR